MNSNPDRKEPARGFAVPMQWLFTTLHSKRNFLLYSMIGVSGATLDYASFVLMLKFVPIHYLLINAVSTSLGISNNFILNAKFNFKVKDRLLSRFASFFGVGLLGMAVASLLLYLLIDLLSIPAVLAKGVVIFVIVILQYNLNKHLSFSRASSE